MRKILKLSKNLIYLSLLLIFFSNNLSFAQVWSWWKYGDNPMQILETVREWANKESEIQETALDWVTNLQWWYPREYKIANTLEYFRNNIQPYLQWLVYIWLTVAVILLIYNWFLMVTNSIHKKWDFEAVKKNIINIWIWVFVLTWFYFIIKLIVAIINSIFWWFGWSTWFS